MRTSLPTRIDCGPDSALYRYFKHYYPDPTRRAITGISCQIPLYIYKGICNGVAVRRADSPGESRVLFWGFGVCGTTEPPCKPF